MASSSVSLFSLRIGAAAMRVRQMPSIPRSGASIHSSEIFRALTTTIAFLRPVILSSSWSAIPTSPVLNQPSWVKLSQVEFRII